MAISIPQISLPQLRPFPDILGQAAQTAQRIGALRLAPQQLATQRALLQAQQQMAPLLVPLQQTQLARQQALLGAQQQLAPFVAPAARAKIALAQVQAAQSLQQATDPWAGKVGTIPPVQTARLYAQHIKETFGENSPQYLNALHDLDLQVEQTKANINRSAALTSYLPLRALGPAAKTIISQANVAAGLAPTGEPWETAIGKSITPDQNAEVSNEADNMNLIPGQTVADTQQTSLRHKVISDMATPEARTAMTNQLALYRNKLVTDEDARKRLRFATNVDKSFQLLNQTAPNALSYSHPGGALDLAKDRISAAEGFTPARYQSYVNFKRTLDFVTQQLIQFYGMSRQPEKAREVARLVNTINFSSNPQQAMATLAQIEKVFSKERNTYIQSALNPDIYRNQPLDLSKDLTQQFKKAGAALPTITGKEPQELTAPTLGVQPQPAKTLTENELTEVARRLNLNPAEVRRRFIARGYSIAR